MISRSNEASMQRVPDEWTDFSSVAAIRARVEQTSDPYCVSADVGSILALIIVREKCRNAVEFGAGLSSVVIASALQQAGGGKLLSIEQNPSWCEEPWREVASFSSVKATLHQGTIRLRAGLLGLFYEYTKPVLDKEETGFDLVFIDAPPGSYGRDGTLIKIYDRLAHGALIVVDDANRNLEQRMIRRWLKLYPDLTLLANDSSYGRGIAILKMESCSARGPGMRARIDVWRTSAYDRLRLARAVRHANNEKASLEQRRKAS